MGGLRDGKKRWRRGFSGTLPASVKVVKKMDELSTEEPPPSLQTDKHYDSENLK